jgi:hypothetical protein
MRQLDWAVGVVRSRADELLVSMFSGRMRLARTGT